MVRRSEKRTKRFKKYYGWNLSVLVLWSRADFLAFGLSERTRNLTTRQKLYSSMLWYMTRMPPITKIILRETRQEKLSLNLNNSSIDQESEYEMYMMVPCLWFTSHPRFLTWDYQRESIKHSAWVYLIISIFSTWFSLMYFHIIFMVFCFPFKYESFSLHEVIYFITSVRFNAELNPMLPLCWSFVNVSWNTSLSMSTFFWSLFVISSGWDVRGGACNIFSLLRT